MKRYQSYKDSGVEWIGQIPSHWDVCKIKYHFNFTGGATPSTENGTYWNGSIPWVSSKDMKSKYIHQTEDYITEHGLKNSSCSLIPVNSLILVVRSGILQKRIPVAINKVELVVNQDQKVFLSKGGMSSEYMYYFITGYNRALLCFWIKEGATVESIDMESMTHTKIPIPSVNEQFEIVTFLDNKTAKIDDLIQKKERKIDLLKEYRIALINKVVTKGLNPDVEMKDSGVEWIGMIPCTWVMTRIGFIGSLLTGYPWKSDLFDFEHGVKICRGENVSEGFLRWGDRARYWKHDIFKPELYLLEPHDIVVSMDGSKVGKNYTLIHKHDLPILLHQRMCRIRCSKAILPTFLIYLIGSNYFRYYIDTCKTDPMIPHITQKDIFDFSFPKPDLDTQHQIVSYLDTETQKIDKSISIEEKKIELLKEYRQSLISNVVTGKVDVRSN